MGNILKKIISGGQTGVDIGALDGAIGVGFPYGGWCPKGRVNELGRIPQKYLLDEAEDKEYAHRTFLNVRDSSGTLIIYIGRLTGGTMLTVEIAKRLKKPYLLINLSKYKKRNSIIKKIILWIKKNKINILNVAGPRESNFRDGHIISREIISELIFKYYRNRFKGVAPRFFARNTIDVGIELIGKIFKRVVKGEEYIGRIVEVEAYLGEDDEACHAFRGRTERTKIFWGAGGMLYIYLIYGVYNCLNIITEKKGVAGCVLIRGIEPLVGINFMKKNRGKTGFYNLTSGPGKLTKALNINFWENGLSLSDAGITISDPFCDNIPIIGISKRIGVSSGKENLLRFFETDNPFVSEYKKGL